MRAIPTYALSVRQPWAWAIIFAGKDVENRSPFALKHMDFSGKARIAIHASKQMTRDEYEYAFNFMGGIGIECPPPLQLRRGGIIGSVAVDGIAMKSSSRWFFGPRGLLLSNPEPCAFFPCRGVLGLFKWEENGGEEAPAAKWMLDEPARAPESEMLL